jgi:cell division protein FtsL
MDRVETRNEYMVRRELEKRILSRSHEDAPVYNYESTARKRREKENEELFPENAKTKRKNNFNIIDIIILCAAFILCIGVVVNYINLATQAKANLNKISNLESEYNSSKIENDKEYQRIVNNLDLDEIKRVAIEELGMHYPVEGQIMTYESSFNDYVQQYSIIE